MDTTQLRTSCIRVVESPYLVKDDASSAFRFVVPALFIAFHTSDKFFQSRLPEAHGQKLLLLPNLNSFASNWLPIFLKNAMVNLKLSILM